MMCWHFTTKDAARKIQRDGGLKARPVLVLEAIRRQHPEVRSLRDAETRGFLPAGTLQRNAELQGRPVVWFSKQQYWDHQAGVCHEAESKGHKGKLSMSGMAMHGNGLMRFGVAEDKLLGWYEILVLLGLSASDWFSVVLTDLDKQCYWQKNVRGVVTPFLPLAQIDAVEKFQPYTGRLPAFDWLPCLGEWVPEVSR